LNNANVAARTGGVPLFVEDVTEFMGHGASVCFC
jgi:hypothetical protein